MEKYTPLIIVNIDTITSVLQLIFICSFIGFVLATLVYLIGLIIGFGYRLFTK